MSLSSSALSDTEAMQLALAQARAAAVHDDVPIGAVVVRDGVVIAARHNERELHGDPTAHAEVLALRDAATVVGHWRLTDCTLYVTVEPCVMCAGALNWSHISRIVFGAFDEKGGYRRIGNTLLHPKTQVTGGVLEAECADLMKAFFKKKRSL